MEQAALAKMIAAIANGSITPDAAVQQLRAFHSPILAMLSSIIIGRYAKGCPR